jgi:hypothetical protein
MGASFTMRSFDDFGQVILGQLGLLQKNHYIKNPAFLKSSRRIVLRKPGKSSYESPSAWCPIALLKTIGKVVEKLLARRIRNLAEEHHLLYPSQIGARAERGTGTALELLTSMV